MIAVPSARRTSHIDIHYSPDGGLVLDGAARDLVLPAGDATTARVTATIDPRRILADLVASPPDPRLDTLLGRAVGRGFRAAVADALGDEDGTTSPLYLLLDELPVAALISGYALLYRGHSSMRGVDERHLTPDLCAGWASEGTMLVALRTDGRLPVPQGPPLAGVVPDGEAEEWHELPPLPVGAMRRRRLVEVGDDGAVRAMFRDTHVEPDGVETVLHEYALSARLDAASGVLRACVAEPVVLPWRECPAAAASAGRLDGRRPSELRELVGREFRATTTCTHLNDLLRSLADLNTLSALLAR